jgi:hypothetical protein
MAAVVASAAGTYDFVLTDVAQGVARNGETSAVIEFTIR